MRHGQLSATWTGSGQQNFAAWLRTGIVYIDTAVDTNASVKFNPNHDPANGRFAASGVGASRGAARSDQTSSAARLNAATRERIVTVATAYIGSQAWADSLRNGDFGPNTNKCNEFVHDALTRGGASPGTPNHAFLSGRRYPPTAEQWADPSYKIPGWRVLTPFEKPMPGDVVAQKLGYFGCDGPCDDCRP